MKLTKEYTERVAHENGLCNCWADFAETYSSALGGVDIYRVKCYFNSSGLLIAMMKWRM